MREAIPGGLISAVNLSEVVTKLADAGIPEPVIRAILQPLGLETIPFDEEQAYKAGMLRIPTREIGLSSGDRACLGLAQSLGMEVLTADRAWSQLDLGVRVRVIR